MADLKPVESATKPAPLQEPTSEKRVIKDKDDLLRRDMILLLRASVAEGAKADGLDAINEFQSLEDLPPIGPADFEQELNCKILPTDSSETHGAKDFSPRVFCRLRRIWGIKMDAYLQSWAFIDTTVPLNLSPNPEAKKEADKKKLSDKKEDSGVLEKNSSKSSFFIYSHDRRFLIKSLSPIETVNLRNMLPKYFVYMRYNPNSIITRIVGLHMLTIGSKRIPFCVQQSVLPVPLPPLTAFDLYDLKGQKNRAKKTTGSDKKKALKLQILKEGDFSRKIIFNSVEHDQAFRSQLKKDLQFLADDECIEYSFLLGIHTDTAQVTPVQEKRAKKIVFFTRNTKGKGEDEVAQADSEDVGVVIPNSSSSQTSPSNALPLRSVLKVQPNRGYKTKAKTNPEMFRLPAQLPVAVERSIFKKVNGGVSAAKNEVYYIGLIDILKRAEKKPAAKAAPKKKDDDSEADRYALRLEGYILSAMAPPAVPLTALEVLSSTAKP